ncbi:O-antigen ligase family protein [Thorsellia anophelis]|uniref:O-antigen ligase n=1 Tax=Thorsellia anophelis DSM 18579 TaxID=1123402 RepID=A0A1I0FGK4_9GAMM|nr:O-antigen ligase family protein [Thorsellia anophelis]SET56656.1 O-antigen ligase [Thorsellia anophelis DSM 18579]
MINIKSSQFWFKLCNVIFLISLALTPIHTKISGVAWVSFFVFSLFIINKCPNRKRKYSDKILVTAIKYLIFFCAMSLVIRWVPQIALGEFNQASNFYMRILVITVLSYFLCKKIYAHNYTLYLFRFLPYSLLFFGISALAITLPFGASAKFGTHPIPWAASISILVVVLHIHMLNQISNKNPNKVFILLGWLTSIAVLVAILLTGKRGSYFYLVWLVCYGVYMIYIWNNRVLTIKYTLKILIPLVILFAGSCFFFYQFYYEIWERILLGYNEIIFYFNNPILAANTSVGARLYMWHNSILNLDGNLLFGLGIEGTEAMINRFSETTGAPMLNGLNQLHNEYLQALVSYGLLGLISFMLFPLGLLIVAAKLRKYYPNTSFGLLGVTFLFLTASLTNTNTYHNYLGTVFSLAVGLIFIVSRLNDSSKQAMIDSKEG